MNEIQLRAAAVAVGAQTYTQGPMRAVVGVSMTFAQLASFASAVAADERGTFAQTAAEWNAIQTTFAVNCETDRCVEVVLAHSLRDDDMGAIIARALKRSETKP